MSLCDGLVRLLEKRYSKRVLNYINYFEIGGSVFEYRSSRQTKTKTIQIKRFFFCNRHYVITCDLIRDIVRVYLTLHYSASSAYNMQFLL